MGTKSSTHGMTLPSARKELAMFKQTARVLVFLTCCTGRPFVENITAPLIKVFQHN